jgi:HAMP domain-containing protein
MRNRVLIFVLLLSLGCAFLGLVLLNSETDRSVTLAELVSRDSRTAQPKENLKELVQSVRHDGLSLASLEVDLIFYAVLAICGILLAIRAIVSAVRLGRAERILQARNHSSYNEIDEAGARPVASARSSRLGSPVANVAASSLSATRRTGATRFFPTRAWARLTPYGYGLTGRMIFTFTAVIAAFGALTLVLVYFTLTSSLTKQWIERARVTAVNVSDSASVYLFRKDAAGLREILRRYASRPGMAYVLIEDRKNKIVFHSFTVLPEELQNAAPSDHLRSESQRVFRMGDRTVYEVSTPVLEGRSGAVRVGIWKDEVDADISKTIVPIIKLVVFVVCGGILMAILLVWRITRPILRLVNSARRISEGELDTLSLTVDDISEFGELSRSFERMRSSVKAAMSRLQD